MTDYYGSYKLETMEKRTPGGRYSVGVRISRVIDSEEKSCRFKAEDNIHYILEVEAAKEGINLGKNLIDRGMVGF